MMSTKIRFQSTVLLLHLGILAAAPQGWTADLSSKSIYHSKSVWETQDGTKTTLSSLRGLPVVVAMVYTSCQASCPLILADLNAIKRGLSESEQKGVRFGVFSFDSVQDTPVKLKAYAEGQFIDLTRWTFYHGALASVRELATLLGVRYKKIEGGGFDHSNVISILDSEGVIVHQQIGVRQSPVESLRILRAQIKH